MPAATAWPASSDPSVAITLIIAREPTSRQARHPVVNDGEAVDRQGGQRLGVQLCGRHRPLARQAAQHRAAPLPERALGARLLAERGEGHAAVRALRAERAGLTPLPAGDANLPAEAE